MSRGLDHIVHAVRDLDTAADFYRRAGFTVGARNRHPWGTHNHIVQLAGFFIEILNVAEPHLLDRDDEHRDLARLFGVFNRDAIARGDGFSTLILESKAIAADVSALASAGIGCSGELRFSRQATQADGSNVTVGFSLGFASDETSPHAAFAVMQQHNPGVFWNEKFQSHTNGARAVLGAVLIADNPTDHHVFLSAFTGERELHSTSAGIAARTPRGDVEIIEPVAFRDRFGVTLSVDGEGMTLAGLRIGVAGQEALEACARDNGVALYRHLNALVTGPATALGATLIFEPIEA
ncbi:VOC family protein [Bradyrhizobium sp. LHD-71]|uniref:VOC family protein n=1 Tax=Bradyrhizobium sp. LHD-71 TaxID=3072141 RepID=UPI0028102D37|nr:VOC family protein [Bradyrhizobium sp. LHD-71]MDQ8728788.1 VOC family protein [Bradyrhizobium sp. LHD-71]